MSEQVANLYERRRKLELFLHYNKVSDIQRDCIDELIKLITKQISNLTLKIVQETTKSYPQR